MEIIQINYDNLTKEDVEKLNELVKKSKSPLSLLPVGTVYYSLLTDGETVANHWVDDNVENERYKMGNIYLTEEECKFTREKQIIATEMERVSKNTPNPDDWSERPYFLCISDGGDLYIDIWDYSHRRPQGVIFFPTEESLQGIIDRFGENQIKKYIFRVDA